MAGSEPQIPAGVSRELFELVYRELRELARRRLRKERPDHTLRPTDLVHELFMRLSVDASVVVQSRSHFLALAGRVMRQILVDYARRRSAVKHGGGLVRVPIEGVDAAVEKRAVEILDLERALEKLAGVDAKAAEIVVHRFYGGLTDVEIGDLMGRSDRWVRTQWTWARAWLRRELETDQKPDA